MHTHAVVAVANFNAHFLDVVDVASKQVDGHTQFEFDNLFARIDRVVVGGGHVDTLCNAAKIKGDLRIASMSDYMARGKQS